MDNIIPDPVPGYPAFFDWAGRRWYLNKSSGYYTNNDGYLLHRAVWGAANGPIPEGSEINHVDLDRSNNRITNLQVLSKVEHLKWHAQLKAVYPPLRKPTSPEQAEYSRKGWERRRGNLIDLTCEWCSASFQKPAGSTAKYCSTSHGTLFRRREAGQFGWTVEKRQQASEKRKAQWALKPKEAKHYECQECGTAFVSTAQRAKWCSRSCGSTAEYRRRKERRAAA